MSIQELIEGGYVAQAILATGVIIGILWQVTHGLPIDPLLATSFGALLGYYFRMGTHVLMNGRSME